MKQIFAVFDESADIVVDGVGVIVDADCGSSRVCDALVVSVEELIVSPINSAI